MNRILLFIAILISGASCTSSDKEGESSLKFEMIELRVKSPRCGETDTIACATFEVNYPKFENLNEAASKNLNEGINNAIGYDNPEAESFSMEEKAQRFVEDFDKYNQEFNDQIGWYFQVSAEPELVSDTLISISVSSEFFTGGAHGGFTTYYVNVDPRDGSTVTLKSFFKRGYEETLRDAGETAFREIRLIPDSASFAESGFEFPQDKFKLNENYGFRTEGIIFFFNNYEIAPYALGPTEILIPYEVMREWIQ